MSLISEWGVRLDVVCEQAVSYSESEVGYSADMIIRVIVMRVARMAIRMFRQRRRGQGQPPQR